jgi:hypothetical protein
LNLDVVAASDVAPRVCVLFAIAIHWSRGMLSTASPAWVRRCCTAGSFMTFARSREIFMTISFGTPLVTTTPPQPSPEKPG